MDDVLGLAGACHAWTAWALLDTERRHRPQRGHAAAGDVGGGLGADPVEGLAAAARRGDIERAVPAFWDAGSLDAGRTRLAGLDREQVLLPLLDAAAAKPAGRHAGTRGRLGSQLTRRLRDALHRGLAHLQFGQVLLASIGSTAPFVGLFGTVWGIYHALLGIAAAGSITIDKVSGRSAKRWS
jgi:biopolymer transport protein ExbB/TolQ